MNWKLTDNKNWDSLEQQFQWVQDMNFVMQHHLHHEEGSVAVHTRMVLEALQQQPEYRALPAKEQEILWAAALLHDVEKRSTSVDEGGGIITSKGHARRGEYTARTILTGIFLLHFISGRLLLRWCVIMVCRFGLWSGRIL